MRLHIIHNESVPSLSLLSFHFTVSFWHVDMTIYDRSTARQSPRSGRRKILSVKHANNARERNAKVDTTWAPGVLQYCTISD